MDVADVSATLVEKWATPVVIPNLHALSSYFQQPLKDNEKIPISQEDFDAMCTPHTTLAPELALSEQQLAALFRVSEDARAPSLTVAIHHTIDRPPPKDGTEDRYHFTYDMNISTIIESILPDGEVGRNSNRETSTQLKWPDYSFRIRNYCILRGEEKGARTDGDPARELLDKLTKEWLYKPLSWILGLLSFYYPMTKFSSSCHSLLCSNHEYLLRRNSE